MEPEAYSSPDIPRVLVVTNDFPPRVGGVQQYEWDLVRHLPPDRVSVLAPAWPGWREHDAEAGFEIERWPARFMWPLADLERRVRSLARRRRAEVVLFGQGLPLPLIGPALAADGLPYVAMTHGYELWMARLLGTSAALRRALASASAVTAISEHTARAIRPVVPRSVPFHILPPAVDTDRFSPLVDGSAVRERLGLGESKVILCVSRLVPRKGQDVLIRGMEIVHRLVPEAVLVIVGDGPYAPTLRRLAADAPPGSVVFAGPVAEDELPTHYAACDVFAMPCRSRWGGLEVEGFGIVYLEAAASGKPSVVGWSGGAPEAVADGITGWLVEGREAKAVALAIGRVLLDSDGSAAMGTAARARVQERVTWPARAAEMAGILRTAVSRG